MSKSSTIHISNLHWDQLLDVEGGFKATKLRRLDAHSWISPKGGREFAVYYDNKCLSGYSKGLEVVKIMQRSLKKGALQHSTRLYYPQDQIEIELHSILFDESALVEKWFTVTNKGVESIRINRLDSFSLTIPKDEYDLMYYKSGWAMEFDGIRENLKNSVTLESRHGRSTSEYHPWFTVFRKKDGEIVTGAIAWSGNWKLRFEKLEDEGFEISGGINDWEFYKDLECNSSLESPHVMLALGGNNDLNETSVQFARVGRLHWYPHNGFSKSLPVEWNHWWPYEDKTISESVFHANIEKAESLGVELCTLDAGWFGPSEPESFWYDYRGDWHLVNSTRFPNGLREVSDDVHKHGMKFGLWCEIEALGRYANLAEIYPEFVATRDGERIGGYVCFGNPLVQEWAFQTLDSLITENQVDWVKIDFNVDPGAGCNRNDHGHGKGDGLYAHYQGYYKMMERIRVQHPNVVFESCSGGGMRLDLGILKQTHTTFISDSDWPEHNLQVFWGATTMLAPDVCLHWSFNEWRGNNKHPRQTFNPHDPGLSQKQIDYYIRTGMLGGFGYSQRLPDLPDWILERYAHHTMIYQKHVKRFVREADCYRLTEQPKREFQGDRWAAFQYSMPSVQDHLLFVFRLDQSENERTIRLRNLNREKLYHITWLSSDKSIQMTGEKLMDFGITFDDLSEEDSALIVISLKPIFFLDKGGVECDSKRDPKTEAEF